MSTKRVPDYAAIFEEAQRALSEEAQPGPVLRCFSDIEPEPLRWLWPGRIPLGKLTLLIGDPGQGKSLVTVDLAARLSRGIAFADDAPSECGGTIFLSAEDDAADTIRPRLDSADADVSRILSLQAVRVALKDGSMTEKSLNLETDIPELESALVRNPGARLIVIDPLSAYLGGTDSHSNGEIRGLLSPLAALASRRAVAVVGITHLRKSPGPAVHRAIGSIAFAAAARSVWAVAADPADPDRRLMLPVKQNLSAPKAGMSFRIVAPNGIARIEWDPGDVTVNVSDILGEGSGAGDSSALAKACGWLTELLADGPVGAKRIRNEATAAGFSWITVRRAADTIRVSRRKSSFGGGWEWLLTEHAHSEDAQLSHSQMSTFEQPVETAKVDGNGTAEDAHGLTVSTLPGRVGEEAGQKYVPDSAGPGCTCRECSGHFGTVAGWRAHIARGRCASRHQTVSW
jgi:hypothetical protein